MIILAYDPCGKKRLSSKQVNPPCPADFTEPSYTKQCVKYSTFDTPKYSEKRTIMTHFIIKDLNQAKITNSSQDNIRKHTSPGLKIKRVSDSRFYINMLFYLLSDPVKLNSTSYLQTIPVLSSPYSDPICSSPTPAFPQYAIPHLFTSPLHTVF